MTGWKIYIHKQSNGGDAPAESQAPHGELLAVWQANVMGLRWIDGLVKSGDARNLGGYGYPSQYTAQAQHVREALRDGLPHANEHWISGEGDVFVGTVPDRNRFEREALEALGPDEWLLIEAWDES